MALAVPTHLIRFEVPPASRLRTQLLMIETSKDADARACTLERSLSLPPFDVLTERNNLLPTEHPNAMPTTERCPGQPTVVSTGANAGG